LEENETKGMCSTKLTWHTNATFFVHKTGQDGDEKFLGVSMVQCAHFVLHSSNIYRNTQKFCCNEKCQAMTTFCLHHTMETLSYNHGQNGYTCTICTI